MSSKTLRNWSLYANGTDVTPIRGINGWNYYDWIGEPNFVWEVGSGAMEQNGTYDMMGNSFEWIEVPVLRGGDAGNAEFALASSSRAFFYSWEINASFRVVELIAIPEPASVLSLALGSLLILGFRRLRRF